MKCGGTTRRYKLHICHICWISVRNRDGCLYRLYFNMMFVRSASQMIAVLVDKMVRTQIVDCAAVANWLFSQDMAHEFTRYKCLTLTLT